MARVLVTGASGFVGGRLVRRLAERGEDEVGGLYRSPPDGVPAGVRVLEADLTDAAGVVRTVGAFAPRRVFHLAALAHPGDCDGDPVAAIRVQAGGTAAVLAAVEGSATRVLFSSTSQVYGQAPPGPIPEETPLRPDRAYGRSKLVAEEVARRFADRGVGVVIARPFNHSGAGQEARYVLPAFAAEIRRSLRDGDPVRTGNLEPRRDFLHVEDVLDAYELLIERGEPGASYNVCRGEAVRIGDLLVGLQQRIGSEADAVIDPARARRAEAMEVFGCSDRLRSLGWSPRRSVEQLLDELSGR